MNSLNASDPDSMAAAAVALAASSLAADQERLRQALGSSGFLLRLNSEGEYARLRSEQLRVARVIRALAANTAPAAIATLAFLAENSAFLAEESRQELLLRAVAGLRPAPPAVVRFFDVQSRPDASNLHLAIDCIVANGSEPAIALLERRLDDPDQAPENVEGWMRDSILRHRYDLPLLAACERLLRGKALSPELKNVLLEALFDYRPREWYPPDSDRPRPPSVRSASAQARAVLQRIGDWAFNQKTVPKRLKTRIRAELESLSKPGSP